MYTYDPAQVVVALNGVPLTGKGPDQFLSITKREDDTTLMIGADGEGAIVRSKDESGTIEITLMASSAANDIIQAAFAAYKAIGALSTILIKDLNGRSLHLAETAAPLKRPDITYSADGAGEVTWTWVTDRLVSNIGGSSLAPQVPATP